jgi:prevent-host-death family protein
METEIGAYEAKTKLPELLRRVAAGERFVITNRGLPVAELGPVRRRGPAVAAVNALKAHPKVAGVSTRELLEMIRQGRR